MWTNARYQPTALFSLRASLATSSGGRTLVCPTAFAIKMALLDAACRTQGVGTAQLLWPVLRDLRIKVLLPPSLAVINTFTKIVRPKKHGPSDDTGTGLLTPLNQTIAYREYVSFGGELAIAATTVRNEPVPPAIVALFVHITSIGKRGSFMQLLDEPHLTAEPLESDGWTTITDQPEAFAIDGLLQLLDDCGPKMTFAQADIYSTKRITLGKERLLRQIVLPYRQTRSGRSFTLYERLNA